MTHLGPGDFIGRMSSAALILDDGRISEAHALVSLRSAELQLLALRGRFAVDGQPMNHVALAPGQVLTFADGLDLVVEEVALPDTLAALEGDGLPRQILASSASLHLGPPPNLSTGSHPSADARLWTSGARWRVQVGDGPPTDLDVEGTFTVGGRTFRLVEVHVERAGVAPTQAVGGVAEPLRIVAGWDTAQIFRAGRPPVVLAGIAARMVSELAAVQAALPWDALAREIWPDDPDRDALRRRLDVALVRLRHRLRSAGVRTDLVRPTGAGFLELQLYDGDVVEDRS